MQSSQDFMREGLVARGYTPDRVEVLDSFPYNRFEGKLDKQYVAFGFTWGEGTRQGEMGSDFKVEEHTIEVYTFATDELWGRNIANLMKDLALAAGTIPLKDIGDTGEVIDQLEVLDNARAERVPINRPKPWEEHVWITRVRIRDSYYAELTV